jgi:hypothetical protein
MVDVLTAQQVTRFLARLATDDAARAELASQDVSAVSVARLAARHGYDFSPQELLARVHPLGGDDWQAATRKFDRCAKLDRPNHYVLFLEEIPMSKEAISAFFKKAAEDPELQKKLVELAAAQGFDFSTEELSDTDLDSIAGGAIFVKYDEPTNVGLKGESLEDKPIIKDWK